MINMGLVWRSKSLSPANINHHDSRDDGRHTSQLIEHAKGHRFFLFASVNRDPPAFPEYISIEEDLFKAARVYVTMGKSLAWIINTADKRVLNSLYDRDMCLKAGWCMRLMREPISEKSVFVHGRGRCEEEHQLSVAVMMSTTFNHNRPTDRSNTWRAAVLKKVTFFFNINVSRDGLCRSVLPPQVKGHGSCSRCSSKQNRWGRPCDSPRSHKAVQCLMSWQYFTSKHVGKRSSVTT